MTAIESKGEHPLAIDVRNLRKSYGKVCAADGLSFAMRQDEIFALLGVNGTGNLATKGREFA